MTYFQRVLKDNVSCVSLTSFTFFCLWEYLGPCQFFTKYQAGPVWLVFSPNKFNNHFGVPSSHLYPCIHMLKIAV